MLKFILRRLGQSLVLLLLVSLIGFFLLQLSPGGPLSQFALAPGMTQQDMDRIAAQMGFDRPLAIQYLDWASGLVIGDWGTSYRDGRAVLSTIMEHLAASLLLTVTASIIAIGSGMVIGVVAGARRHSTFDHATTIASLIVLSFPTFWLGLLAIYVFSVNLRWLPAGSMSTLGDGSAKDVAFHLVMPALVLALTDIAVWSRYMRSAASEVISQDFFRTAVAKGMSRSRVIRKHVIRNAILPIIPLLGLQLPALLGGAVITETVFAWPGVGRLFLDSLTYSDYPVALGILMLIGTLVVLGSLLADILSAIVDPRIRLA